jgi:hypothetical protein
MMNVVHFTIIEVMKEERVINEKVKFLAVPLRLPVKFVKN